jgi:hypothetical protein
VLLQNNDIDASARKQETCVLAGPPPTTQQRVFRFSIEEFVCSISDEILSSEPTGSYYGIGEQARLRVTVPPVISCAAP